MKISKSALTLTLMVGSTALSAAELHIPMAFEYLALDGRKVSRSMVMHKSELELTPGYHEIAIRYNDMVETDLSDTPETVKSNPFIVTMSVDGRAEYTLKPAGGDVVRNPLEFAEAPQVVITREGGGSVDYRLVHTDIKQNEFKTRLYGKTLSPEAQAQAAAAAVAVSSTQLVPEATAGTPVASSSVTVTSAPSASASSMGEVDVLSTTVVAAGAGAAANAGESSGHTATPGEMLQVWWQRADEQTRKDFLSWAIKQL